MSGVVAIKSKDSVVQKLFYSLSSIQHRGQDSAGIIISDGSYLDRVKAMGLVNEVFNDNNLKYHDGKIGIGHVRSAPEGCNRDYNVEPLLSFVKDNELSIAHDGNLINYYDLKSKEENKGMVFHTQTDSELILFLIARYFEGDIVKAVRRAMEDIKGAYSCVLCMPDKIVGFRDYNGIRPLMIGFDDENVVIASENAAIEILDIDNYRDVKAGEIVVV